MKIDNVEKFLEQVVEHVNSLGIEDRLKLYLMKEYEAFLEEYEQTIGDNLFVVGIIPDDIEGDMKVNFNINEKDLNKEVFIIIAQRQLENMPYDLLSDWFNDFVR